MRRVSAVAASSGVFMSHLLVGMIMKMGRANLRAGRRLQTANASRGCSKCNEPEEPAHDREARLHHVAPPIGRLPLGKERAVVELKARWLLGDVDVDRCPGEDGGYRERKLSNQHLRSPSTRSSGFRSGAQQERPALHDARRG